MVLGLVPKVAAVVESIPHAVLGGAGVALFGMVAASASGPCRRCGSTTGTCSSWRSRSASRCCRPSRRRSTDSPDLVHAGLRLGHLGRGHRGDPAQPAARVALRGRSVRCGPGGRVVRRGAVHGADRAAARCRDRGGRGSGGGGRRPGHPSAPDRARRRRVHVVDHVHSSSGHAAPSRPPPLEASGRASSSPGPTCRERAEHAAEPMVHAPFPPARGRRAGPMPQTACNAPGAAGGRPVVRQTAGPAARRPRAGRPAPGHQTKAGRCSHARGASATPSAPRSPR